MDATAALGAPRFHTHAGLETRDHVGARDVAIAAAGKHLVAVGVVTAEVEQVDAGEGDEEPADEGEGVDSLGGVEALEEDEGGAEGGGREGHIVQGVDTGTELARPCRSLSWCGVASRSKRTYSLGIGSAPC